MHIRHAQSSLFWHGNLQNTSRVFDLFPANLYRPSGAVLLNGGDNP